jgi:hypothetical protein
LKNIGEKIFEKSGKICLWIRRHTSGGWKMREKKHEKNSSKSACQRWHGSKMDGPAQVQGIGFLCFEACDQPTLALAFALLLLPRLRLSQAPDPIPKRLFCRKCAIFHALLFSNI